METRESKGGVVLSGRLQMLADMVMPGNRLVDVGCDHGFLSIYLVRAGICPGAIAMDVREGPLAGAKRHVEAQGLGDYISLRLSDGLSAYGAGEADTLVCAGMGGRLMERILRQGMEKAYGLRELILQPQSEIPQLRAFLRREGFLVTREEAVLEEGKYYFAMRARPGTKEPFSADADHDGGNNEFCLYDLYGEHLLKQRHPVLFSYLRQRRSYLERLGASLEEAGSSRAGSRREEVREETARIEAALAYYG
ncbi:MAG: SAM-dependent methyltransferase [Lachnospiraceae bacterium]|nr:SAM-dependent methyltransferase [Lachnospiraceae bacterium]